MQDLLDQLEREARQRANSLEATGKLPAGFTETHYPLATREQRELRRLKTALLLADNPDTFVALVHEQQVPRGWMRQRLRELGVR